MLVVAQGLDLVDQIERVEQYGFIAHIGRSVDELGEAAADLGLVTHRSEVSRRRLPQARNVCCGILVHCQDNALMVFESLAISVHSRHLEFGDSLPCEWLITWM